ncbi:MAG: insulinase family protein [Ferruginibacter sp.]|nr:insulinase family protein [Ferruginibacter sp.]
MKKILSIALFALFFKFSFAQNDIDRSKPPKAGPAPVISIPDPTIFTLSNGMTVIVVENHKLPKVSATLNIDRGPVEEGKKAGLLELTGQMLGEGTTKTSKEKFDEAVDFIGANVGLNSSGGYASALSRYFESAFFLMAEAIQQPAFPEESFNKLKNQTLTALKSEEKSATAISKRVSDALSYGKKTAQGEFVTEETINNISLNDIKKAYQKYISPSRSYLTFVGDITPEAAKALTEKAFGDWKGKKQKLAKKRQVKNTDATEINFVDVPTAVQAEISVGNLIDNPLSNPDYHALLLANQILGGGAESKLFLNLREKHGFTYGSYSKTGSGRYQSRFSSTAQVRSEKADSAVAEIISEINNMREGKITQEELEAAKALYNGSFALGMEDPAKAATYASNILINELPKDFYRTFLQKVNDVTLNDVQRVSVKYFEKDKSRIVIVGNGSKILPNLSRLGYPVKLYDKYANPSEPKKEKVASKSTSPQPSTATASSIIEGFLKAIGGIEEISKIYSTKSIITLEVMGTQLSGEDVKMAPDKRKTEIKMGKNVIMKKIFDGKKGLTSQMGKTKDFDDKEIKESQDERAIVPQLFYLSSDHNLNFAGTEKIGEEDAYKLRVTKPSGNISTEYYSTKSGLLLKEESLKAVEGTEINVETNYTDYKKAGNILLPFTITRNANGQEFKLTISEIKINEGVTDEDFK